MARSRKRHVQQDLFKKRGGKRRNAGRRPRGRRASERHKKRPAHNARHPVHVTLRVVDGLGPLRKRDAFEAIRNATVAVVEREGFRIVHFSIQRNHIHLLAEALDEMLLASGLQAFEISAAKRLNRVFSIRCGERRKGQVFADRYHARALTSPRAVRHAIAYVLNNWRRHQEDLASFTRSWKLDPYSNGADFPGWDELGDSPFLYKTPPTYFGFATWLPKTWLLRVGWTKAPPISVYEVPGRRL